MIYKNIKKLADEKNISIAALERKCGFGNGTIRRWEDSSPTIENLGKVADYFKKPIKYFLE